MPNATEIVRRIDQLFAIELGVNGQPSIPTPLPVSTVGRHWVLSQS